MDIDEVTKAGWAMWLVLYRIKNLPTNLLDGDMHNNAMEAMDGWIDAMSERTEDGHTKAPCPQCEAIEHIQILDEYGVCMTCAVERDKDKEKK